MIEFFRTSDGRLHLARIAGMIYVFGLPWTCNFRLMQPRCGASAVFAAGFWLAFCGKRGASYTLSSLATPIRMAGVVLILAGLASLTYLTRNH